MYIEYGAPLCNQCHLRVYVNSYFGRLSPINLKLISLVQTVKRQQSNQKEHTKTHYIDDVEARKNLTLTQYLKQYDYDGTIIKTTP